MTDLASTQRTLLLRSIYVLLVPIFLLLAVLACAGTALTATPSVTCPTVVPATPQPTVLPGTPTPPPLPTVIPPTPVVIVPPADFYPGDAVLVGMAGDALAARFRLDDVASLPTTPDPSGEPRRVFVWSLTITNLGTDPYEVYPAGQMVLTTIVTAYGDVTGTWAASQAAADAVGVPLDNGIVTLAPGVTRTFRLAAFGPDGEVGRFAFRLDPTVSTGGGTITWTNAPNPYCDPITP